MRRLFLALAAALLLSACQKRPAGEYVCREDPRLLIQIVDSHRLRTNLVTFPADYAVREYAYSFQERRLLVEERGGKKALVVFQEDTDGLYFKPYTFSKKSPNQRPERNAGATSSSPSEPPPGVAHP